MLQNTKIIRTATTKKIIRTAKTQEKKQEQKNSRTAKHKNHFARHKIKIQKKKKNDIPMILTILIVLIIG